MKLALAQINTTVGDFDGNRRRIRDAIARARDGGADIVVFPELTVCGYPPRDLLDRRSFLLRNRKTLDEIAAETRDIVAIIGFVDTSHEGSNQRLFNAAAVIRSGEVVAVRGKTLLPTYDVFDEYRHFEPTHERSPLILKGRSVGLTICEDIWNEPSLGPRRVYPQDPPGQLVEAGAEILVNLSASPFHLGRERERLELVRELARKHGVPVLLCNQVGGNDELVFDGNSVAVDESGTILATGHAFEEDLVFVDLQDPHPLDTIPSRFAERRKDPKNSRISTDHDETTNQQATRALVLGIGDYVRKCGFSDVLIGLSGGIDSSLVAALAARALGPAHVTGVAMPSPYSSEESLDDARELADNIGIRFLVLPIHDLFDGFRTSLRPIFASRQGEDPTGAKLDLTEQNIQARIRGDLLMSLSNFSGSMVLSTGNKSELAVGYCTLYGDLAGGLAAISDVPKTMVYAICRELNRQSDHPVIPERVLTKPPSAELKFDQKDSDSLPPYDLLDAVLHEFIEEEHGVDEIIELGFDPDTVRRIVKMVVNSEYKRRQAPPGLRMTTKAFGSGRRMPVAQAFRE